jgi:hypothetical protein
VRLVQQPLARVGGVGGRVDEPGVERVGLRLDAGGAEPRAGLAEELLGGVVVALVGEAHRLVAGVGLEEESLQWLRRHDEREYSFVDATSFALMRKLGIREAFTFEGDFAAAGSVELRP